MILSFRVAIAATLLAAAPPLAAQPREATVTVELDSFHFSPGVVRIAAGARTQLRLVNRSTKTHDFAAPQFFAAAAIAPSDRALVTGGKVTLGGGETRIVHFIAAPGRYRLKCSRPFHSTFGMRGEIVVG